MQGTVPVLWKLTGLALTGHISQLLLDVVYLAFYGRKHARRGTCDTFILITFALGVVHYAFIMKSAVELGLVVSLVLSTAAPGNFIP